ncbi:MAG: hypothetical protein WD423_08470 [Rhodothermales bacterium]
MQPRADHETDRRTSDPESKQAIERELAATKEAMIRRVQALEHEITSTPAAVVSALMKKPLLGVAGAVALGMGVGLFVTRRKRRGSDMEPLYRRLVDEYIEAASDEVRHHMKRGRSLREAMHVSFRDRAPLIVYESDGRPDRSSGGFLSTIGSVLSDVALSLAVRMAFDAALSKINKDVLNGTDETAQHAAPADHGSGMHAGNGAPPGHMDASADVP